MFRIGEFSKIAQVSGRLLRYYDEIGLLTPVSIDDDTGYRFYSATQLPRLNRILALKDLGLSLDQIARMLDDNISPEEIRGMLMMKQAQIEQSLLEEVARFRHIESRLRQIDSEGSMIDYDVVIKSVPTQRFISIREMCANVPETLAMIREMHQLLPARAGGSLGQFVVIGHSEMFEREDFDIEFGYFLADENFDDDVTLSDGQVMTIREVAGEELMATVVRVGTPAESHMSYGSLGMWAEANGYRFAGPVRELFLEVPKFDENVLDTQFVTEIQIPVEKLPNHTQFLREL